MPEGRIGPTGMTTTGMTTTGLTTTGFTTTGIGLTGKRSKGTLRLSTGRGPMRRGNKGLNFLSNKLIPNEYSDFDPTMKQRPLTSFVNNGYAMAQHGGKWGSVFKFQVHTRVPRGCRGSASS